MSHTQEMAEVSQMELLAVTSNELNSAKVFESKLKKLTTAMTRLVVLEKEQAQIKLLAKGLEFVDHMAHSAPRNQVKSLSVVRNELVSLKEGIFSGIVPPEELVVFSLNDAVRSASSCVSRLETKLRAVTASSPFNGMPDNAEKIIQRNSALKSKMPQIGDKEFVIARAPVTFAFKTDNKFTRVGYLNKDILNQMGFKADLLDGYCILYNQLTIGVNPGAVHEITDKMDDTGKPVRVPIMVKDRIMTFKKGVPTPIFKKRPKTVKDLAEELAKSVSQSTGIPHTLISDHAATFQGASWFWLMPNRDLARLSKAFPGSALNIHRWGFAF